MGRRKAGFETAALLELLDDALDVLALADRRHEGGVGGGHDGYVLQADRGQKPALATQVGMRAVDGDDIADDDIAVAVGGADIEQRLPGAEVVPAKPGRDHGDVGGMLDDCIVDRHRFNAGVDGLGQENAREVADGAIQRCLGLAPYPGLVAQEKVPHHIGPEQEDTGIPVEIAGFQIAGRSRQIRLFHETRDGNGLAGRFTGDLDIAVSSLRLGRPDAEDDEPAVARGADAVLDGTPEFVVRGDVVVRRHDEYERVAVLAQRVQRRHGDRRRRVAADRLEDHRAAIERDAGQIRTNALGMLLGCNQIDRRVAGRSRLETTDRLEKHRTIAGQIVELLGIVLTRERPQPGPDAAAHHETCDTFRHVQFLPPGPQSVLTYTAATLLVD